MACWFSTAIELYTMLILKKIQNNKKKSLLVWKWIEVEPDIEWLLDIGNLDYLLIILVFLYATTFPDFIMIELFS